MTTVEQATKNGCRGLNPPHCWIWPRHVVDDDEGARPMKLVDLELSFGSDMMTTW
uniref:Uncharacterized protein n=1 Tax=Oryza sativa subsp. japonica TaxID=39947 RepID=Q69XY8_ORYSJ|nr:hypothetical protein [Oryza sativa Japonica Group]